VDGVCLVKLQEFDAATRQFAEAVRFDPQYAVAHPAWAAALVLQGKRDEAIKHYEAALRLAPDDSASRESLESLRAN